MVACDLAKVRARVRFSVPAPYYGPALCILTSLRCWYIRRGFSFALIALVVERTLGKGKVTCSNHVESTITRSLVQWIEFWASNPEVEVRSLQGRPLQY